MRKRTNRIRIVLSKIKDVRRKEVNPDGFSFFCRPVKKIIAYYILRPLISCAFIAMDFLWEIYIVLKEKKKNENLYEYFGRILRDRKQCSLIFSQT